MGISRSGVHKRRLTGGKEAPYRKKKKFEMGRQSANTKLGPKCVRTVRVRGGNTKFRGLRLDSGNFSWASEAHTNKTRILDVVYNASNNELVRTKTLVKNAIIQVDATPFKKFYETKYGLVLGKKGAEPGEAIEAEHGKRSNHVTRRMTKDRENRFVDPAVEAQFVQGRLLACIASRPGQSGRCDGYILEGKELEFYAKKLRAKGKKGAPEK